MSYAARLIHSITHVRIPRDASVLDDYGQPIEGAPVETELRGLVQPRSVRELTDQANAGTEIGDHVIFLPIMDVDSGDSFVYDGDRYTVRGVRRFAFGRSPHLEVDVQKVDVSLVGA